MSTGQIISTIGFSLSGLLFIVAVVIFFSENIIAIIGDLSGRTASKQIQLIRQHNIVTPPKSYRPDIFNVERGGITDPGPSSAGRKQQAAKNQAKRTASGNVTGGASPLGNFTGAQFGAGNGQNTGESGRDSGTDLLQNNMVQSPDTDLLRNNVVQAKGTDLLQNDTVQTQGTGLLPNNTFKTQGTDLLQPNSGLTQGTDLLPDAQQSFSTAPATGIMPQSSSPAVQPLTASKDFSVYKDIVIIHTDEGIS